MRRTWIAAGGLAVVAVVAAAVAVTLISRSTPPLAPNAVTVAGDQVVATGMVRVEPSGLSVVCTPLPSLTETTHAPICSKQAASLVGLDRSLIPGILTDDDGVAYALGVQVRGVWTGDAIQMQSARLTDGPGNPVDVQQPPCPDVVGFHGNEPPGYEAALAELAGDTSGRPDDFAGTWPSKGAGGSDVIAVGVVGSLDAARVSLGFKYPICLVHVQHSASRLVEVSRLLQRTHPEYDASLEYALNAVRVDVPVLDGSAANDLSPFGTSIYVFPLVRKG